MTVHFFIRLPKYQYPAPLRTFGTVFVIYSVLHQQATII